MKIFLDTTCLSSIQEAMTTGLVNGLTTNPSLMKNFLQYSQHKNYSPPIQSSEKNLEIQYIPSIDEKNIPPCLRDVPLCWWQHIVYLCSLCPGDVSLQVNHGKDMVTQGLFYQSLAPNIVVKVPAIPEGLKACQELSQHNIRVNVTLCFTPFQALLAAKSHAYYVSPFLGRLNAWCKDRTTKNDDTMEDGEEKDSCYIPKLFHTTQNTEPSLHSSSFGGNLIYHIRRLFDQHGYSTKILAASLRSLDDVQQSLYFGANAITLSPQLFWMLFKHPLTTQGLDIFSKNFEKK